MIHRHLFYVGNACCPRGKRSQIFATFRSSIMTVEEAVQDGPKEVRPAKRRKVEQNDPFRPFRLVPSPQEARGLETSTPLAKQP